MPWLVWFSGLSAGLETKELPVQFPARAHAWVASQVPSRGQARGNRTLMFPSFSPSPFLKINKENLFKKRIFLLPWTCL